jgi:phosphate-selective porin OprO/OprP
VKILPIFAVFTLLASSAQFALAEEDGAPWLTSLSPTKVFDKLWGLPVLYEDQENPVVQRLALMGRYQGQLWGINSDFGSASGWENRRQRLGARMQFLRDFQADVTFNLNFDGANTGRFLQDFEDFGVRWRPVDFFHVEAGLFKVPITEEWRESSNTIVTIERSDFINMAVPRKLGGVLVSGKIPAFTTTGAVTYGAGIYSAARGEDWQAPSFNGGAIFYQGLGYRFNEAHLVRFDNSVLTNDSSNNVVQPYPYLFSLTYDGRFADEKLRVVAELVGASGGFGSEGLLGVILLPTYRVSEQIELVCRYQYLGSDAADGVRLQRRYEREVPDLPTSWGNHYQAVYGGVNYYLYKNRMKIMAGLEYSHMNLDNAEDYNQITLFGAFRVWF